jgi:demethylmenaquinone methyltransferase / 2-methoxy-6-polyprenyl-1,4-benzoquinol methylase
MSGRPTPERVVAMFDRIAPHYDVMNTLMTGGLDRVWRRNALDAALLRAGMRVLDVATGTGKLAVGAAARVSPGGEVVGLDPAAEMLARARRATAPAEARLRWVQADAQALPFADGTFDAVIIGFGLRNLPDVAAALREMSRVAAPGGRVVVLEIAAPDGGASGLLFRTWFRQVVPRLGALAGSRAAYRYLPESVGRYPAPGRVAELMHEAGLREVRWRWLLGGMVTLHVGQRERGP